MSLFSLGLSLCFYFLPMPVGWIKVMLGYYRHSMVWLSRLRFQFIPGNAASHKGTTEPNHDAAKLLHVIEVAGMSPSAEKSPSNGDFSTSAARLSAAWSEPRSSAKTDEG